MQKFVLVDCNNFFVSCERVFNPKLHMKPVVVLSSNDACVIARSNEAKALGIPMGAPAYEYLAFFKKHNITVLSSNFALYADMSQRVMQTLSEVATDIEPYSIDEAFLFFPTYYDNNKIREIRLMVKQRTGIPISVGVGSTKTLAKMANHIAKKGIVHDGVFDIAQSDDIDALLSQIEVGDIWGIGYRYAQVLRSHSVTTAKDFKYLSDAWVRKHMSLLGLKTLHEVRGIPCLNMEEAPAAKQSITVSRMFGKTVTMKSDLLEAAALYISSAAEKLREQQMLALRVHVVVVTTEHREYKRSYAQSQVALNIATSYTPSLIAAAHTCIQQLFIPGRIYKKVSVMLTDLVIEQSLQMNTIVSLGNINKQTHVMRMLDAVNKRWGRNRLYFAAVGTQQDWKMRQLKKTPCFTTNWHELLNINI